MKRTVLGMAFTLVSIFAMAGNKTECTMKVQGDAAAKEMKADKQNSEQESTERKEALRMIYNINNRCKNLSSDIKAFATADSLNDIVWKHRDSLDKLSKNTLEEFVANLASMQFFQLKEMADKNVDSWKDAACKKVASNTEFCINVQYMLAKIYDDIFWKRQRILDQLIVVTEYSKAPADNGVEIVKRLLDSPEVCSFIGKQHIVYIGVMKGFLEMMEKQNSKSKELMKVTDEELSKMFDDGETENFGFKFDI